GVPLIVRVPASNDNPGGSPLTLTEIGAVPATVIVWEYTKPTVESGGGALVIFGGVPATARRPTSGGSVSAKLPSPIGMRAEMSDVRLTSVVAAVSARTVVLIVHVALGSNVGALNVRPVAVATTVPPHCVVVPGVVPVMPPGYVSVNDTLVSVVETIEASSIVSVDDAPGDTVAGENVLLPPSGAGWTTIVYVASASGAKPFDACT